MNFKYTPGPWHRNIRAGGKYPVVFAGRNTHVAMATQQPSPEETEANIDLIAAAPTMLDALLAICDSGVALAEPLERVLLDAIAKAKGER